MLAACLFRPIPTHHHPTATATWASRAESVSEGPGSRSGGFGPGRRVQSRHNAIVMLERPPGKWHHSNGGIDMDIHHEEPTAEAKVERLEELEVIEAADLEQAGAFHAFRFKL